MTVGVYAKASSMWANALGLSPQLCVCVCVSVSVSSVSVSVSVSVSSVSVCVGVCVCDNDACGAHVAGRQQPGSTDTYA